MFEVVVGDLVSPGARWPAIIQQYSYGSRVAPGGRYREDSRHLAMRLKVTDEPEAYRIPDKCTRITVSTQKTGEFKVTDGLSKKLDLRPGLSISGRIESWASVLAIRAVLAKDHDAFWNSPKTAARTLGLRGPEIIVATDSFEHVVGPGGSNAKLRRLPSSSAVFRSLSQALAGRDPGLFSPGRPNLDWRKYARKRSP